MSAHIKSVNDETLAMCGELLTTDFHFKSVDAAVLNGLYEPAKAPCPACVIIIVNILAKNIQEPCDRHA